METDLCRAKILKGGELCLAVCSSRNICQTMQKPLLILGDMEEFCEPNEYVAKFSRKLDGPSRFNALMELPKILSALVKTNHLNRQICLGVESRADKADAKTVLVMAARASAVRRLQFAIKILRA